MNLMKNYLLIMLSLMFSLTMMISTSPLMMWILMELSTMMFIINFILMQNNNINSSTTMSLIQAFSSALMLAAISNIPNHQILLSLGILLKMGMYPAHNWMPMVINLSPWKLNMITMTIPKIAPMMMMSFITDLTVLIMSTTATPIIISIKIIQTTNIKMIMALSSIIHSSWMTLAQTLSTKAWSIYLILYTINTIMICLIMSKTATKTKMNLPVKLTLALLMFSLMGTPPILMFTSKLYLMTFLETEALMPLMILVLSSAISIIYYTRIFMKSTLMYSSQNKTTPPLKMKPLNSKSIITMMMILIII